MIHYIWQLYLRVPASRCGDSIIIKDACAAFQRHHPEKDKLLTYLLLWILLVSDQNIIQGRACAAFTKAIIQILAFTTSLGPAGQWQKNYEGRTLCTAQLSAKRHCYPDSVTYDNFSSGSLLVGDSVSSLLPVHQANVHLSRSCLESHVTVYLNQIGKDWLRA